MTEPATRPAPKRGLSGFRGWNFERRRSFSPHYPESAMLGTILLIILVLLIIGALPSWPYSSGWGYYPSGGLGLVLIILLILLLMGRI